MREFEVFRVTHLPEVANLSTSREVVSLGNGAEGMSSSSPILYASGIETTF